MIRMCGRIKRVAAVEVQKYNTGRRTMSLVELRVKLVQSLLLQQPFYNTPLLLILNIFITTTPERGGPVAKDVNWQHKVILPLLHTRNVQN